MTDETQTAARSGSTRKPRRYGVSSAIASVVVAIAIGGCALDRGAYFGAGAYEPRDLPTRYGARASIPIPVLGDDDDDPTGEPLRKLHKKTWSLYFRHLRWPRAGTGFPSDYIDEAFNPHLFQWDTAFMMFFGRYAHRAFPAIVSLDNFYAKQRKDGFICRELDERTGEDFFYKDERDGCNPPILAWAEWEYYRVTGDEARLARVLSPLVEYFEWVQKERRHAEGYYWNTPLGSGMDNTPRSGDGWICMTAQQALAARCIAEIARVLDRPEVVSRFTTEHAEIARVINEKMWDAEDRFYYDVKDGKPERVKTPASFWPLIAGVVPAERARALANHMRDPKTFWRPHMIPTLAADHPDYQKKGDYWRGSVWAPTNYQAVSGFAAAGFHDLAHEIAKNHLEQMLKVFDETETIWENYAPEAAARGDKARSDFVGWSGLGPTALLYEHVFGLDADGTNDTLTWRIRETRRHGLRQFCFGRVKIDVVARERSAADAPPVIDVTTDRPFTLIVRLGDDVAQRVFNAGTHTWKVSF